MLRWRIKDFVSGGEENGKKKVEAEFPASLGSQILDCDGAAMGVPFTPAGTATESNPS